MPIPSRDHARLIGEKTFREADQTFFAALSGDCNPMHMDAAAARRLITGKPVVHGVHVFLTALEFWDAEAGTSPDLIDCTFKNPINVGDSVSFRQWVDWNGNVVLDASVNGLVCAQVTLSAGGLPEPAFPAFPAPPEPLSPDRPLDLEPSAQVDRAYRLALTAGSHAARFPKSCRLLGENAVAAIAALSAFVGMVCPGLHSVFSSFGFRPRHPARDEKALDFFVRKYDARFSVFEILFDGCIRGTIRAFQRPPPQVQPGVAEIAARVRAGEFAGTRSLIIGGSRGLGELTAKILAAGGGKVALTYAAGVDDARQIQAQIAAMRRGECHIQQLDLTQDAMDLGEIDPEELDVVYFFATPRIYRKKAEVFDAGLFAEFSLYYLKRFHELCVLLERRRSDRKVKVYVPSTVFIAERPKGMAEYAMAKAAAEILAEEINRTFAKVSVVSTRLPRLSTDQTASIFKLSTESNLEIMLPLVRSLYG